MCVAIASCTSNTILEKPKNLIPKDEMVDLLTDILIADGADNIKNTNLQRNINYFPLVFEKYKIDTIRFKESNYYYTSKIDEYSEILEQVNQRLKALKEKYDLENKYLDSIKNAKKDSLKNSKTIRSREFIKRDSSLTLDPRTSTEKRN
ncbi:MAG: DUF4296 domain-containing protein [Lutibacter sp.]|nr:DUF4296 domain-containing protein [Lutibacter sp.]NNJ59169.1 DUF4296 domain-containing protein [Lutibacter sp.]